MKSSLSVKVDMSIERLRAFCPKDEPYFLCYSGGKDSDCIRILATLANVPFEIHHNLTSVDAPETIKYIKSISGVIIDKSRFDDGTPKTMWNLLPVKKMPPTRIARWCCSELKEHGGKGRLKITGVRWEESVNRKLNSDVVRIIGKPKDTIKRLDSLGIKPRLTPSGGVVLNAQCGDNESLRDESDFVHHCYFDRSVTINPIVDWSDTDVWTFLHYYGCKGNPLYECGYCRVGCIGCPLSGSRSQKLDFSRYPEYKKNYIRAFQNMVYERIRLGLPTSWRTGADVMSWWLGDDPDQLSIFSEDELYEILYKFS